MFNESILAFNPPQLYDFVFTSGVLIHINPEELPAVYALMAKSSKRYVCIREYYNPVPVAVNYRGHENKLFKRDFAGEFLKAHSEYKLVAYGFFYRGDPITQDDDSNWFLLEK